MRVSELRYCEVINLCTGQRLGYVCDVDIDILRGCITAIIVPGPCKFFGLFGREEDFIIPFECIKKFGEDIILVEISGAYCRGRANRRKVL